MLATRLGLQDKLKANTDPNAGQIVIMKSDQLKNAQTAVKLLKALSSLLVIAVFALYALAIYLAKRRRQVMLGATGASLVLVGLVVAALLRNLSPLIVDSLVKVDANEGPVGLILAIETSLMRDIAILLVIYGVLVFSRRPSRGQIDPLSRSDGGWPPPSDTIRSSFGRPRSPCS